MDTIQINVNVKDILNQLDIKDIQSYLKEKNYDCIPVDELKNYVHMDMSVGTQKFYDLLSDYIISNKLNLELLIGHVVTKRLMVNVNPSNEIARIKSMTFGD